jgi:hypothetical protein
MKFNDRLANSKPKPSAAFLFTVGSFDLLKALKNRFLIFSGNAPAAVNYLELKLVWQLRYRYFDSLTRLGKLDCIRNQIHQNLNQAIGIGNYFNAASDRHL